MAVPSGTEIRLASRTSPMATYQARTCLRLLRAAWPGLRFRLVPVLTLGDRHTGPLASVGGKGAFVKAIDDVLLGGGAELSVSCAKDLPSPHDRLPGIVRGAVLERDDPRDAVVLPLGARPLGLDALEAGTCVGTGAPRRIAQLRSLCPALRPVPVRGNLDGRLQRLDEGARGLGALVVARSGMLRLGVQERASQILDPAVWLPATGAGIVCVEHRAGDTAMAELLAPLNHAPTEIVLRAERAALAALFGDCATAASVHAVLHPDGALAVHAAVFAPDGSATVRIDTRGQGTEPVAVGKETARRLLAEGADRLLPHAWAGRRPGAAGAR
ncbi:hydroxymethylbilane synthase [Streptomyces sp. NPDC007088]|uniref:hydroxymethylbilane synthase n=1 Tax=Streptomyces sp. NPDC007088 TaxID=3364773 RepID=UPI0036C230C5